MQMKFPSLVTWSPYLEIGLLTHCGMNTVWGSWMTPWQCHVCVWSFSLSKLDEDVVQLFSCRAVVSRHLSDKNVCDCMPCCSDINIWTCVVGYFSHKSSVSCSLCQMGNQSMRPTVASVVEREIQLLWIKRNKFANWVYGESENRSQYGILRKKR